MTKRLILLALINLLFIVSGFAQSDSERRFAKVIEYAGLNAAMFQTPPDRIRIPCAGGGLAIVQTRAAGIDIFACAGTPITATGSAFTFNGTPFGGVSGSGTANRVTMWTAATTLGNSPFANNSNSLQIITNNAYLQGTRTNAAVIDLIGVNGTNDIQIGDADLAAGSILIGCGASCTGRVDIRNGGSQFLNVGSNGTGYFAVNSAVVLANAANIDIGTNNFFLRGVTTGATTVNLIGIDASDRTVLGNTSGIIYTPASAIDFNVNGAPSIGNAGFGGAKIEFVNTGAIRLSTSAGATDMITSTQSFTAGAGLQSLFNITPTINQSGTGGYCVYCANVTETGTGSGNKSLLRLQVGGADRFRVLNTGETILGTNNTFLRGTTTGAVNGDLIGIDNSDNVIVGNGTLNTTVQGGSTTALVTLSTAEIAILGDSNGVGNNTQFKSDDANSTATMRGDTNAIITTAKVTFNHANYQSCTALTTNASGDVGCTVSDKNLKTNVQPFTRGLKALSTITPKTYTFANGFMKGETRTGFVAQDVAKTIPEAVSKTGAGVEQIDNVTVTAVLVNAVNELSKKVEELQKKVDNLTKENKTLKGVKIKKGKTRR